LLGRDQRWTGAGLLGVMLLEVVGGDIQPGAGESRS
jgi:hypothetical protein